MKKELLSEEVSVVRGQYGLSQPCEVADLVVGDVVLVETGMRVPADCLLLDGMDITCDETIYNEDRECIVTKSISKGEEHHRENNPDPFLLAHSLVLTGKGRALVCAVGEHTRYAHQFPPELFTQDEELTPLQVRLEKLAGYLGKWGYISGGVIFVGMTVFLVSNIIFSEELLLSNETLMAVLRIFTTAVAVVIVAIPEGLPLAVSISMAFATEAMKKDNLLVKKAVACENLGYIKEVCTGKTATLTRNDMHVDKVFCAQRLFTHSFSFDQIHPAVQQILIDCIIMNCDSRVEMSDDAFYVPAGNGTEVAFLRFLQDNQIQIEDLLTQRQRLGEHECCIPFNPVRKRQTTVIRPHKGCDYVRVVCKGAPEYVTKLCTK